MENPIKMDDLGVPLTTIFGNIHIQNLNIQQLVQVSDAIQKLFRRSWTEQRVPLLITAYRVPGG